jgi:hypothetical protein
MEGGARDFSVAVRLSQNSARPDLGGDPDPGRLQMQTGRGNIRSGGIDIPVCPNAMTQQILEHGLQTIGTDRNVYPTGFCNNLGRLQLVRFNPPALAPEWFRTR